MARHATVKTAKQDQHEPTNKVEQDELLTVSEVARRLRVDTTTVRRWVTLGSLEAVILPHQGKRLIYRIRQSTLNDILMTPLKTGDSA
jgi:excisionase family DNA binding protein